MGISKRDLKRVKSCEYTRSRLFLTLTKMTLTKCHFSKTVLELISGEHSQDHLPAGFLILRHTSASSEDLDGNIGCEVVLPSSAFFYAPVCLNFRMFPAILWLSQNLK